MASFSIVVCRAACSRVGAGWKRANATVVELTLLSQFRQPGCPQVIVRKQPVGRRGTFHSTQDLCPPPKFRFNPRDGLPAKSRLTATWIGGLRPLTPHRAMMNTEIGTQFLGR